MTLTRSLLKRTVAFVILAFLVGGNALLAQDTQAASEVVHERGEPRLTPPERAYTPDPDYPKRAIKKKVQGTITLSVVVNADGSVRDAKITKNLDDDLDRSALECVKKWKFKPATQDATPVAMRINVEVDFHMR